MSTISSDNRLRELDALRGLAAIAVVFFHYSMDHAETTFLFRFGATGVDLFFMISGFVILMSLEKIRSGKDFIINRFARLYPTYWASVTFTLIALYVFKSIEHGQEFDIYWKEYFANLTMFQYYLNFQDLDGPYWTMIIEMVFYMTMLLLFYTKALRFVVPILLGVAVCGVLLAQLHWESPATQDLFHYYPLLGSLPLFLAGIVFYRLYTKQLNPWLCYGALLVCYVSELLLFEYVVRSRGSVRQIEYAVILAVFFGAFILFVHHKLRFIVNPVTLFLGKISYALYLVHQFISIGAIIPGLMRNGVNYYVACCVALPVAIGVAALITYFVEIPVGRMIKKLFRSRATIPKT
jgi:peptidoglycan/LPS O-acetylase OafA/YrhL